MSIEIDAGLLAAAVKALGITIPIRSARKLKGGAVEVWTRDGRQVWRPLKEETASKRVSKPVATRKRAAAAKKVEVTSEADD